MMDYTVPPNRPFYSAIKRSVDVLISLAGLVLLSPVLSLSAIAVKLSSTGPVFFKQERIGRAFRPFQIIKFRTMVVDAPRLGSEITAGSDPRITRVGWWLRKLKIDELPQLWNVLIGQMSLVGPRPEVPKYVALFRKEYEYVLSVRPGITDLASIKYRDESDLLAHAADPEQEYVERILPNKLAISRQYISHASLWGDFVIILRTALAVFR